MTQRSHRDETDAPDLRNRIASMRRGLEWVFIAQVAWSIAVAGELLPGEESGWWDVWLCVTAGLLAFATLLEALPLQNALAAGAVLVLVTAGVQSAGFLFGLGPWAAGSRAGTPWVALTAQATIAVMVCRPAAKQLLRGLQQVPRYGYYLLLATSSLVTILLFSVDTYAVAVRGYWHWGDPLRQGAMWRLPLWFLTAMIAQVAATPWLLRKKPGNESPISSALLVWTGVQLYLGIAEAIAGFWGYTWVAAGAAALGPFLIIAPSLRHRCSASA